MFCNLETELKTEAIKVPVSAKSTIDSRNYISLEETLVRKALTTEEELKRRKLYHNLKELDLGKLSGGPRVCFVAEYGLPGRSIQSRILKMEKVNIESEKARLYQERGCGSENDFDIAVNLGQEAYSNKISPVLDLWIVKDEVGFEHAVIAEQFFDGYKSIQALLPELKEKPLTKKEFSKISSDVLTSLSYMDGKNVYHRDMSLRNIITNIRSENKGEELEARLTDCANACSKEHPTSKVFPTMGAKQISDPLMIPEITGKEMQYGYTQEIYSIAKDFLDMLNGEVMFEVDSLTGKVIVAKNELTSDLTKLCSGIFDSVEYETLIKMATDNMPNHAKKYAPVIKRALSFVDKERYSSVSSFISDWREHSKKDFASRAKDVVKAIATTAVLSASTFGIYTAVNQPDKMDTYKVHSEWNKETNCVDNNYLNLDIAVWSWGDSKTAKNPSKVFVKRGESISTTITANFGAVDEKYRVYSSFKGKVYIEGANTDTSLCKVPFNNIFLNPVEAGFVGEMGMTGYFENIFNFLKIPQDAPAGTVYNMVIEMYPPADTLYSNSWNSETQEFNKNTRILFEGRDKAVITKRIPIIVSDDAVPKGVNGSLFESTKSVVVGAYHQNYPYNEALLLNSASEHGNYMAINHDIDVVVRIPELDIVRYDTVFDMTSNCKTIATDLPDGPSKNNLTLQTIVYSKGKVLSQSFMPFKRESVINEYRPNIGYSSFYDVEIPDTAFAAKVFQYSKEADKFVKKTN